MCHRSVGLIQNVIEGLGITTLAITIDPGITYGVGAPRAAYLRFPYGSPAGEPFQPDRQRTILRTVLESITTFEEPGQIIRMPLSWRRG